MQQNPGYSATQIILHWLTAILVVAAWITSGGMEDLMDSDAVVTGTPPHVLLGLGVLVTVVLRLALRAFRKAPAPADPRPALRMATAAGHGILYLLALGIPIVGMMMWGGGVEGLDDIHQVAGNLLLILAGGHAVLALFHHYVLRDGTLARMLRPGRV